MTSALSQRPGSARPNAEQRRPRRPTARAALALVAAVAAAAAGASADRGAAAVSPARDLLPDLVQEPPRGLVLARVGTRHRLGFESAARNVGAGPLLVVGRRAPGQAQMRVDQIVARRPAGARVVHDVGRLSYVSSPDHSHWHLVPFMRYDLVSEDGRTRLRDRKTGFCLGDRYPVPGRRRAGAPRRPVHTGNCGLGSPGRRLMRQGISVGYGDDYAARLDGQYIDITGLPAGRYRLVHRVNASRALRERSYGNNSAALRLALSWHRGRPRVRTLAVCPAGRACADLPARAR